MYVCMCLQMFGCFNFQMYKFLLDQKSKLIIVLKLFSENMMQMTLTSKNFFKSKGDKGWTVLIIHFPSYLVSIFFCATVCLERLTSLTKLLSLPGPQFCLGLSNGRYCQKMSEGGERGRSVYSPLLPCFATVLHCLQLCCRSSWIISPWLYSLSETRHNIFSYWLFRIKAVILSCYCRLPGVLPSFVDFPNCPHSILQ